MKFECYKDKLYLLIMSAINIIFIFSIIICLIYGLGLGTISFLLLLGIFDWYFFSLCYFLNEDGLVIRVMIFKKVVQYEKIVEVKQTVNTLSSFSLSRQRIGIRIEEKIGKVNYIYVSPKEENKFLDFLLKNVQRTKIGIFK